MSKLKAALKPRKLPIQARSTATVDALHTATIQVLTQEGLGRCTTTRVAERAGMSVGSLYQYYPNRDALLAAVLEKHLAGVADAVAKTCRQHHGEPLPDMATALVTTFLAAKLRDPAESKALYAVASECGGAELTAKTSRRTVAVVADMLASSVDAHFDHPTTTAAILLGALVGPVRALLEGRTPAGFEACLEEQLILLAAAYLQACQR